MSLITTRTQLFNPNWIYHMAPPQYRIIAGHMPSDDPRRVSKFFDLRIENSCGKTFCYIREEKPVAKRAVGYREGRTEKATRHAPRKWLSGSLNLTAVDDEFGSGDVGSTR